MFTCWGRRGLAVLCLIAWLAGCAVAPPPRPARTPAAPPPAATRASAESEIEIAFQISGGIGGIERSWVIRGDGSVMDHNGKTYALPPAQVAQLLAELTAAGFFELDETYEDIACADCFAYSITVNDGQRAKRVRMLNGGQLPEQAQRVVGALREFVSALEP
ncbi:MAG: hypothetical protein D6709_01425 [Chloroflexi bacterium]|uniref:Uncharacterized protein n=1 Tax=Candidatus Thermofonsia Clade 3 bacterium TaxID=2364212 RepID=A0A2M8QCT0_9CHLR|nr:protealysin inhibitor emfourin [Candidatus Roseilinea sp. NK_OTU-006]PJF47590.1 MAG: hypothetical protein CUN48_07870 [Candidatus Thermofonsia Clade 3 bacterium]RMG65848.1 MAG: hypothetical protein D6709_01425 [Chloroflexota bacterium]